MINSIKINDNNFISFKFGNNKFEIIQHVKLSFLERIKEIIQAWRQFLPIVNQKDQLKRLLKYSWKMLTGRPLKIEFSPFFLLNPHYFLFSNTLYQSDEVAQHIKKNQPLLLELISKNKNLFDDSRLKTDVDLNAANEIIEILEDIENSTAFMQHVPEKYRDNKKIILALLNTSSSQAELIYNKLNETLKNDPDIILKVARIRSRNFHIGLLSPQVRNDKNIILPLVKHCRGFQFVGEDLQSDPAVVLNALECDKSAFAYAHSSLTENVEFILKAIKVNAGCLDHVKESLLEYIFENHFDELLQANFIQAAQFISRAKPAIEKHRKLVLAFVSKVGEAIQHVDPLFKKDKEIVMAALNQAGWVFRYVQEYFNSDREALLKAVEAWSEPFFSADEVLRKDVEVISTALKHASPHFFEQIMKSIDPSMLEDPNIALQLVEKNGLVLKYLSASLQGNKPIVMAAVKNWGMALQYASSQLKKDSEVVKAAFVEHGASIYHADVILKGNKNFILQLAELNDFRYILAYASSKYAEAPEFSHLMKQVQNENDNNIERNDIRQDSAEIQEDPIPIVQKLPKPLRKLILDYAENTHDLIHYIVPIRRKNVHFYKYQVQIKKFKMNYQSIHRLYQMIQWLIPDDDNALKTRICELIEFEEQIKNMHAGTLDFDIVTKEDSDSPYYKGTKKFLKDRRIKLYMRREDRIYPDLLTFYA